MKSLERDHRKILVIDGHTAFIGGVNLADEYINRKVYHHLECAAYLYRTACIPEIEKDFQAALAKCRQVSRETVRKEKWTVKAAGCLMKVLAPLM